MLPAGRGPSIIRRLALVATLTLPALVPQPAGAQLSGGSNLLNGLGGLGGGLPSVTQAAPANVAGVLQYCLQNNLLSQGAAGSTESALTSQLGGATQSSDYQTGTNGMLETGNNQTFNLESAKSQVAQEVCNLVLQHAKSLL